MRALGPTKGVCMTRRMRQRIYDAAGLGIGASHGKSIELDQGVLGRGDKGDEPINYIARIEEQLTWHVTRRIVSGA